MNVSRPLKAMVQVPQFHSLIFPTRPLSSESVVEGAGMFWAAQVAESADKVKAIVFIILLVLSNLKFQKLTIKY